MVARPPQSSLVRVTSVEGRAGSAGIEKVLARVKSLPTLPAVAARVGALVEDPDSDSGDIAAVMKQDPSITARVLTLANSAYYAIPGGVADVRRAISYLGFNTVYQLVLTVSIIDALPATSSNSFDVKELWKHSLGCAIASEAVAKQIDFFAPEELFTCGLLHDIGKVAMASFFRETLEEVVSGAKRGGITFHESELSLGVPGHAEIGGRLAVRWRLPASIAAAINYHHRLSPEKRVVLPPHLHPVADIVALADVICRRGNFGSGGDEIILEPDPRVLDRLNLTALALGRIQDEIPRAIERSRVFLELLG